MLNPAPARDKDHGAVRMQSSGRTRSDLEWCLWTGCILEWLLWMLGITLQGLHVFAYVTVHHE